MTKKLLVRAIVVALIAGVLGGGYAIVLTNGSPAGSQTELPSGFGH